MKNNRLNNKGFSLVELIVAVIILGIVSGGAIAGFSSLYNAKVSAATKLAANQMKKARSDAMAMHNIIDSTDASTSVYTQMYVKNGDVYSDIYKVDDSGTAELISQEKLSNDKVTFTFKSHSDASSPLVVGEGADDSDVVRIYYKKGSGGISKFEVCKADGSDASDEEFDQLVISNSSDSETLIIVAATGRSYVDN